MAKIVLADDDEDLRELYAVALERAGHAIYSAVNGREALDAVRRVRPDLLLLDLWMPEMDGLAVLNALRHDPAAASLRIVILSNLSDSDSRLEAFEAGASYYLVKDCAIDVIVSSIEAALNSGTDAGGSSR